MSKMTKKEINSYLKEFKAVTGLHVVDGCSYVLSTCNGDLKVTFRLADGIETVFTSLVNDQSGYNLFKEFEPLGYSSASGKQNYFGDGIYTFLNHHCISFDIKKSDTALTAKIKQSMFDKTGVNKMFDVCIYKGGDIIEASNCITYMSAMSVALDFKAQIVS